MSADLQAELEALQWSNYVSAVLFTAVIYDYCLIFSREVEYVWHKPWTWVTTVFAVVRLTGIAYTIASGLYNITWFTRPLNANVCALIHHSGINEAQEWIGGVLLSISSWSFTIFLAAGDFVMILRVYAIWNQSKRILFVLLFLLIPQVLFSIIVTAVFYGPRYLTAPNVVIIGRSICLAAFDNTMASVIQAARLTSYSLRLALSVMLITLGVIPTMKQSMQTYKALKQWQPNKYMQQFAQDGTLYFFLYLLFSIDGILQSAPTSVPYYPQAILSIVSFSLIIPMTPRFIISMRELYERDARVHRRRIDTAFGLTSQSTAAGSTTMVESTIAFASASAGQRGGQEAEDDMEMSRREGKGAREALKGDAKDSSVVQLADRARQV